MRLQSKCVPAESGYIAVTDGHDKAKKLVEYTPAISLLIVWHGRETWSLTLKNVG
jgi:hypothetical protein